jgi:hypothetical protein
MRLTELKKPLILRLFAERTKVDNGQSYEAVSVEIIEV